ncbi:MAG: hypothetical protein KDJ47_05630 [Hyphomicrobiaceae bacterium]|nr:hypothetical protein [Hyphomicrobiaceae bacterium]
MPTKITMAIIDTTTRNPVTGAVEIERKAHPVSADEVIDALHGPTTVFVEEAGRHDHRLARQWPGVPRGLRLEIIETVVDDVTGTGDLINWLQDVKGAEIVLLPAGTPT